MTATEYSSGNIPMAGAILLAKTPTDIRMASIGENGTGTRRLNLKNEGKNIRW